MEKEYNIKLIVEFKGKAIGETRQEAITDIDIPDFIDEALHDGHYKIKKVIPQLSMSTVLLPVRRYTDGVYDDDKSPEIDTRDDSPLNTARLSDMQSINP